MRLFRNWCKCYNKSKFLKLNITEMNLKTGWKSDVKLSPSGNSLKASPEYNSWRGTYFRTFCQNVNSRCLLNPQGLLKLFIDVTVYNLLNKLTNFFNVHIIVLKDIINCFFFPIKLKPFVFTFQQFMKMQTRRQHRTAGLFSWHKLITKLSANRSSFIENLPFFY